MHTLGGSSPGGAHFGAGSGPIWLDDLDCRGTEARLADCRASSIGTHNCNHNEDASVRCIPPFSKLILEVLNLNVQEDWALGEQTESGEMVKGGSKYGISLSDCTNGEIRIVNGSTALQGRVEVCVDGNWGTICDAGWGAPEAMVACRQLGFSPTG